MKKLLATTILLLLIGIPVASADSVSIPDYTGNALTLAATDAGAVSTFDSGGKYGLGYQGEDTESVQITNQGAVPDEFSGTVEVWVAFQYTNASSWGGNVDIFRAAPVGNQFNNPSILLSHGTTTGRFDYRHDRESDGTRFDCLSAPTATRTDGTIHSVALIRDHVARQVTLIVDNQVVPWEQGVNPSNACSYGPEDDPVELAPTAIWMGDQDRRQKFLEARLFTSVQDSGDRSKWADASLRGSNFYENTLIGTESHAWGMGDALAGGPPIPVITIHPGVYADDGTELPGQIFGAWSAAAGESNVEASNFKLYTNDGTASGPVTLGFDVSVFSGPGSESIPIDGNVQFGTATGASQPGTVTWLATDADGSHTFSIAAQSNLWVTYRIVAMPGALQDGTYTASYSNF